MNDNDADRTSRGDGGAPRLGGRPFSRRDLLRGAAALGVVAGVGGALLPEMAGAAAARFPIGAAAKSKTKPVSITLWHSMPQANLTALEALTTKFNTSQPNIKVNLVFQNSYIDTVSAYTTALSGGVANLPDVVQWETEFIQLLIDSQSIVPAARAIAADHFSVSDFVPSMLDYFKVDGTQWAMPFNISCEVLYYNQLAFTKAGLDPSKPPTTLAQVRTAAQKIVSSGTAKYGMSLKLDPSPFELMMALGDKTLVNKSNGRKGRATAVTFGDALGQSIFNWWGGMLNDKLAQPTPFAGTGAFDNLLAIGSGIAPMTIDTSAAIGSILQVLGTGQYPNVKLGVGPLPSPGSKPVRAGGVFVGGAGLYIVDKPSSPATQDAAWQYIKFLTEPAQQATWAVDTGYVPVRKSAITIPSVVQAWTAVPGYRVPYTQLLSSPSNPATAGYVTGAALDVDNAILNALTAMTNGTGPKPALAQAVSAANNAISSYNERV